MGFAPLLNFALQSFTSCFHSFWGPTEAHTTLLAVGYQVHIVSFFQLVDLCDGHHVLQGRPWEFHLSKLALEHYVQHLVGGFFGSRHCIWPASYHQGPCSLVQFQAHVMLHLDVTEVCLTSVHECRHLFRTYLNAASCHASHQFLHAYSSICYILNQATNPNIHAAFFNLNAILLCNSPCILTFIAFSHFEQCSDPQPTNEAGNVIFGFLHFIWRSTKSQLVTRPQHINCNIKLGLDFFDALTSFSNNWSHCILVNSHHYNTSIIISMKNLLHCSFCSLGLFFGTSD
mmetsp:Transcript_35361/g.44658  ORF Transcript_35361/g.44658 Transcript_35361/m.44658 type:complete len:287 (-) Transcript_35361:1973-2833(-)